MKSFFSKFFSRKSPEAEGERNEYFESREQSKKPWAVFEITDIDLDTGKLKVEFNWNEEFIKFATALGFQGETPEDTVQLFFYASSMKPTELAGEFPVQPESMPNLSQELENV